MKCMMKTLTKRAVGQSAVIRRNWRVGEREGERRGRRMAGGGGGKGGRQDRCLLNCSLCRSVG